MIKKNSWHYKLANFGSKRVWEGDSLNFCEYFWSVMFGGIQLTIILALIVLVFGIFGCSLYDIGLWIFEGYPLSPLGRAFLTVMSAFTLAFSIVFYVKYRYEYRLQNPYEPKEPKEPGFFKLAYRKWKEKTCFIVKVED